MTPTSFVIKHRTAYTYSQPVFLEPHLLYFYPLPRPYFSTTSFEICLDPRASGLGHRLDAENNIFYQAWFSERLSTLVVEVEMKIQSQAFNPFNFLLTSGPSNSSLRPYQDKKEELRSEPIQWLESLREQFEDDLTFLTALIDHIQSNWDHINREEPGILTANECFKKKRASCRDLAWMTIVFLRHLGFPSRFVSGYSHNPDLGEGHELHAWVEVWVGGGWIGIDPSAGILTTHYYIPVAASHEPQWTLPVQGNFRGSADSTIETKVSIIEQ